jgi:hypothetical protein
LLDESEAEGVKLFGLAGGEADVGIRMRAEGQDGF